MAEQRLIDVGENSICDGCNWEACEGSPSVNNRCYAKRWIDEQPTVDAKPVVHGHWTDCIDPFDGYHGFQCSVCKRVNWEFLDYPFCPRCGARMDEKDGDKNESERDRP